jgi:hypothetical protein
MRSITAHGCVFFIKDSYSILKIEYEKIRFLEEIPRNLHKPNYQIKIFWIRS